MKQGGGAPGDPYGCLFRRPIDIHDLKPDPYATMILIVGAAIMCGKYECSRTFQLIKSP